MANGPLAKSPPTQIPVGGVKPMSGFHHSLSDTSAERNNATKCRLLFLPVFPVTFSNENVRTYSGTSYRLYGGLPPLLLSTRSRAEWPSDLLCFSLEYLNCSAREAGNYTVEKNWKKFDSSVVGLDAFSFGLLNCSGREGKLDVH